MAFGKQTSNTPGQDQTRCPHAFSPSVNHQCSHRPGFSRQKHLGTKRLNYREVQPVRKSRDASTLHESYVNIRGLSNRQTGSLCKLSLLKKTISFRSFRAATEVDQLSKKKIGTKPILPDLSYQRMATQVNLNETRRGSSLENGKTP